MGGDFDSSKGEFRKLTVRARGQTFLDYKKVAEGVKSYKEISRFLVAQHHRKRRNAKRKGNIKDENSYTASLCRKGINKILQIFVYLF